MALTASALENITTGYSTKYRDGLTAMTKALNWQALAEEVTSDDKSTVYPIRGRTAGMREWVGERIMRKYQVYGYTLTNKKFEDTIVVPVDDLEDDKYSLYASQFTDLGGAAGRLPFDQVIAAIKAGNSKTCYDGEYFFDTDHPQDPFGSVATTWSNSLSSTSLTRSNVNSTRTAMTLLKDEHGVLLGIKPTHLFVPETLRQTAEEIVGALALTYHNTGLSTSNTSSAPSNVLRGALDLIVVPELDADSTSTWYMADLSKPVKPFMWQWRVRPIFQRLTDINSEHVMSKDEHVFGVKCRGAAGYGLPQLIFRCAA